MRASRMNAVVSSADSTDEGGGGNTARPTWWRSGAGHETVAPSRPPYLRGAQYITCHKSPPLAVVGWQYDLVRLGSGRQWP